MANFLSGFLNNVGQGLTNPKGNLGDFAHAARLYNTNAFKYTPKVKFLYHVVFNINPAAIRSSRFDAQRYSTAINMLVRAVDLPTPLMKLLGRVKPSEQEVADNPRARSAVMRSAMRLAPGVSYE